MKMPPLSQTVVVLYWDGTVDREHDLLLIAPRIVGYCISEDSKGLDCIYCTHSKLFYPNCFRSVVIKCEQEGLKSTSNLCDAVA